MKSLDIKLMPLYGLSQLQKLYQHNIQNLKNKVNELSIDQKCKISIQNTKPSSKSSEML